MPIHVACQNGHKLRVSSQSAAKTVRCPVCGDSFIAIPSEIEASPVTTLRVPPKESAPKVSVPSSRRTVAMLARATLLGTMLGILGLTFVLHLSGQLPSLLEKSMVLDLLLGSRHREVKTTIKKLDEIAIAFLNLEETHKYFAIPLNSQLSWRVHLLPHLNENETYLRFNLDEPWDSPSNQSSAMKMPNVYKVGASKNNHSCIHIISGPNGFFKPNTKVTFKVPDGLSDTLLLVVSGADKSDFWTKPDSFEILKDRPLESLGTLPSGVVIGMTINRHPIIMDLNAADKDLFALSTPSGGDFVDGSRYQDIAAALASPVKPSASKP